MFRTQKNKLNSRKYNTKSIVTSNSPTKTDRPVIVADTVVKAFGIESAIVFGDIIHFMLCGKYNGKFDAPATARAKHTGLNYRTYEKNTKPFKELGVFKEVEGKYPFRKALVLNTENPPEWLLATINAYMFMYSDKLSKPTCDKVSLVRMNLAELDNLDMTGSKATKERNTLFAESYCIDKAGNQFSDSDIGEHSFYLNCYAHLQRVLGFAYNTVRSILDRLSERGKMHTWREGNKLFMSALGDMLNAIMVSSTRKQAYKEPAKPKQSKLPVPPKALAPFDVPIEQYR